MSASTDGPVEPTERPSASGEPIERAFREEWTAVVATLARRQGDLQLAEDAAQEAFARAAVAWPRDGAPAKPGAWLTVTAWRIALNHLRHDQFVVASADDLAESQALPTSDHDEVATQFEEQEEALGMEDDRLRLIVTCCHPALSLEARVALTLRYVAGLTTHEIASAFLLPEPTLAQRLVRAKRKIRQAGIRFELPAPADLAMRIAGTQRVIYLVFNEGYSASGGEQLVRVDLCAEAIWLGRMLRRLTPDDAETTGLLALMLLLHARTPSRQRADGRPIPLAEQDRSQWRQDVIAEGVALLDDALQLRAPGPYQTQAAIAALHAQAPNFAATDWLQIALLYRQLARLSPSPVVEINRAVAVSMADGPRAGLAVLEPILASGLLNDYAPLHVAHADLLDRVGEVDAATVAWTRAFAATENGALRAELARRVAARTSNGQPDATMDNAQ